MSCDIWLEIKTGKDWRALEFETIGNYTSNVSGMWEIALGFPLRKLQQRKCRRCVRPLRRAIARMEKSPEFYRGMEIDAFSGCLDGAIDFLKKLLYACNRNPRARVKMWY